jgi:cob(I)alamin adenosyltransferase
MNLKKGYIQVYTGNGKGKTTAAIGQAVRAAGAGLKTIIIQFMKEYPYSEIVSLNELSKWITVEQYGKDDFVYKGKMPGEEDLAVALRALKRAEDSMLCNEYNIIILDEIIVAIYFKLFPISDVIDLINKKPDNVELILTGRYCPEEIIEKADLVTEMKEIKHYYTKNVLSRKGIES